MSQLKGKTANQVTGRSRHLCVASGSRGVEGTAGTSRMNREVHVRICGGLEVRFLWPTRQRCGKRPANSGSGVRREDERE